MCTSSMRTRKIWISDQREFTKSPKNDQFPKTLIEGNNVLSVHRFDYIKSISPHDKDYLRHQDKNKNNGEIKDDIGPALTFAQLEGKYYCCGKPGYKSPQSFMKDITPREEWVINKSQMT